MVKLKLAQKVTEKADYFIFDPSVLLLYILLSLLLKGKM